MIVEHTSQTLVVSAWQTALRNSITRLEDLAACLNLELTDFAGALESCKDFALRIPKEFVARMEKSNPRDPLLLQVLPRALELATVENYVCDPLGELHVNPMPGVLHKYAGRVLLTVTSGCAVNCRYCFRRHFPYQHPSQAEWAESLAYIRDDTSIAEVILSGGDPLLLNDAHLAMLTAQIAQISHITTLRIHTRLPIVIPQRINDSLVAWLDKLPLRKVMVIHCNHPQEIDEQVAAALYRLKQHGITLLNQSVLLKDVNDSADTLIALSERLFDCGVLPYYLHQLDQVKGAAHFAVEKAQGLALIEQCREKLPGYLVPRYVFEQAGAVSKLVVTSS